MVTVLMVLTKLWICITYHNDTDKDCEVFGGTLLL